MGLFDSLKKKKELPREEDIDSVLGKPPLPLDGISDSQSPKTDSDNNSGEGFGIPMPPVQQELPPPVQNQEKIPKENYLEEDAFMPQKNTYPGESLTPPVNSMPQPNQQRDDFPNELPHLSIPHPKEEKELGFFEEVKRYNVVDEEIPSFQELFALPQIEELELPTLETQKDSVPKYRNSKQPIFVRTDTYRQILSYVDSMRGYVEESNDRIYSLENIRKNFEIEHKNYKTTLEDIQRKIVYVDKVLFKP